jgi:hypothetical protein
VYDWYDIMVPDAGLRFRFTGEPTLNILHDLKRQAVRRHQGLSRKHRTVIGLNKVDDPEPAAP